MKYLLCLFLLSVGLLQGSVRLYNDSPYKLRAVIRAADGTFLGEMIVLPGSFHTWSDSYTSFGSSGQDYTQPDRSQTPYTVQWSCTDGEFFAACSEVSPGAAITASGCDGPKYCKPKKKGKKGPYGANEDDEQLQYQDPSTTPDSNGD